MSAAVLFFDLFVLVIENLSCDIYRSVFCLDICSGKILADHAGAEKLETTEQKYKHNGCGVTGNLDSERQLLDYNYYHIDNRRGRRCQADISCNFERCRSKGDNTVHCIFEELRKVPLGSAVCAVFNDIGHIICVESDPGENALGEAVIFTHAEHGIDHTTSKKSEVARAALELDLRGFVDNLIETIFER